MHPFLADIPFVWAAHRGASFDRPENTHGAFQEAVRQGADLIELDVRSSRDGEVMVLHDATLERTTNGTGHVWDLSAAELEALDAGGWFDERSRGERIPRLRDVLGRVAPSVPLNIEIKGKAGLGLAKRVVELAHELDASKRVVLSAFRFEHLVEARALDDEIPIGLLYEEPPADLAGDARRVAASFLHPAAGLVRPELIGAARALGLRTIVWTVDDPQVARALIAEGVDGIITNRPGSMRLDIVNGRTLNSRSP